jgi:nucleotide-binding universal stress UspA family protein
VLSYPKLQAVIGDADELVEFLALAAVVVTPTETVAVFRDPDDDRLIEAALAADADVIVTGDQDLLTLGYIGQIQVRTPESSSSLSTRAPDSRQPGGDEFCVIEPGEGWLAGCGFLGEVTCDGTPAVGRFWRDALGWPLVWDRGQQTAVQSPMGGTKIS